MISQLIRQLTRLIIGEHFSLSLAVKLEILHPIVRPVGSTLPIFDRPRKHVPRAELHQL